MTFQNGLLREFPACFLSLVLHGRSPFMNPKIDAWEYLLRLLSWFSILA
jgi:hypothetical protein